MQLIDINTWLSGDLLSTQIEQRWLHALELEHLSWYKEVFKVAQQIPLILRIANGTTKYIFKKSCLKGIVAR